MSAQIVFLSLFLGIVSGRQSVTLEVSGPVKSVRLFVGEREAAMLTQPPWSATIDFGSELAPRELTAVGLDADGNEIARATQILNVPRARAELEIMRDGDVVSLSWHHLFNARLLGETIMLDGKPLALNRTRMQLPPLDGDVPHVLAAELRFDDGFVARREMVVESVRSMSAGTQLTPIAVRETSPHHPATWDGCMSAPNGRAVRTTAVEKRDALVIVVRNPDAREISQTLGRARDSVPLDKGTVARVLWPVATRVTDAKAATSILFPTTDDLDAARSGILYPLLLSYEPKPGEGEKRQFTDAVAVAGLQAVTGARRRAVVLVLSSTADASDHDPAAVRHYLAALGVPLFVWSVRGPRPDLAGTWGDVDDISSLPKLQAAAARLQHALDEQRVAWVEVDPVTALALRADGRCGITPLASLASAR